MARLTELRVKVCSMYGAVCLARLQRCSTRLVCVNKSICWSSVARMRVCVCSVERQEPNGGRRECAGELKILTATGSSKAPSLFLCCRFLSLFLPHSLSLSHFAVNSSSFPLCSPPSPCLCVFMPSLGFCYAHRIDLLPAGVQTQASNVSTPKWRGKTSYSWSKRGASNFPAVTSGVCLNKTICIN